MEKLLTILLFTTASLVVFLLFSMAIKEFDGNVLHFMFGTILSFLPVLLLWSLYCADRAVNERTALRALLDMELMRVIASVDVNTHAWHRMTMRNPWKLYRFDCE